MIDFLIGVFFGTLFGMVVTSMLVVASDSDDWKEENENEDN